MIVRFPNLDTLRLALASGAVPADVAQKAAVAGFGEDDQLWVETSARLPAAVQKELKRLGAMVCKASGAALRTEISCWPELLPLTRDVTPLDSLEHTPVLFDVPRGEELPRLILEMLRLGDDRQGFRWLESVDRKNGEGSRALLRVVGPPYYSLLRAVDRLGGPGVAPHAFIERAPGVWIELGHRHPLAEAIRPPKGKILLVRPPRHWTLLPDAPFRDVYEAIEFQLPDGGSRWRDSALPIRLRVTPRLRQAGPAEGAELWVLRGEAIDELNRFVQNVEDWLLARLAFAVGTKNGQQIVVLRVRPSKLPPPLIVLPAEAYKSYLKLPNLFVPAGHLLHPPLRRDIVRRLLAEDASQVIWLARGDGGGFTPESLPEDVFRPLSDWIDYILDRDKEPLQAWVQAMRFEFEPFVCSEDAPVKPKKPPADEKARGPRRGTAPESAKGDSGEISASAAPKEAPATEEKAAALDPFASVEKVEPSEVEKQLRSVEEKFLSLSGTLDDDAHRALWPRLAELNARLQRTEDAGLCWLSALWEPDTGGNDRAANWAAAWFRTEALGATRLDAAGPRDKHSWIARAITPRSVQRELSGEDLDRLLSEEEPSRSDARALAAYLTWSARREPRPAAVTQRLQAIQQFLEKHENLLPVRACWLAWFHLAELTGGDVLALARARDRLLERLYHNGLRPEQDLPSFLRFAGLPGGPFLREAQARLKRWCDKAHRWVGDNSDLLGRETPTKSYADLLFAFGLARLGAADDAKELLQHARRALGGEAPVHRLLLAAFESRIQAVLDGKPHTGALPAALLEELEGMGKLDRYVVERVRHNSRILEPDRHVDPYRHWSKRMGELDRALADLVDLPDRLEARTRLETLLQTTPKGPRGAEDRAKIVRAGLELGPHLGEEFARQMLDRALPVFDALLEALETFTLEARAKFLEKALFAAAHFGRAEYVRPLVARFRDMLQAQGGRQTVDSAATLAEQSFRSLRKLGMRDEIDWLLGQLANLILQGEDANAFVRSFDPASDSLAPLLALLHVAGSWYYFGRDRLAEPVVEASRAILFSGKVAQANRRRDLACTYVRTAGQAPPAIAFARLEELFDQLKGFRDSFTTSGYYSIVQMDLIESVVLAVVSDDFTQGTQARRWLDDDEFLVRRRIHDDHHKMVAERG